MSPLRAAVRDATTRLAAAGVPSPEHDARALAVHALGLRTPSDLLLHDALPGASEQSFDDLVSRRARREPLQHLVGSAGFRYLVLEVGPGVFVPRPETESVVGWAIDEVRRQGWATPVCVDLCTGSGAIALALAQELPGASVYAVERDPAAMRWARRNAQAQAERGDRPISLHLADVADLADPAGLADPADVGSRADAAKRSDVANLSETADGLTRLAAAVDLVIANPPYVPTGEAHRCDPEVLQHDPALALWGGEDGFDGVRLVERAARRLLRPGGLLVVEHGEGQGGDVSAPALLRRAGAWTDVTEHRDPAGRDRFVTAVRS